MSLNKYMHPRNIYKTPPNFKQMAIEYPEFRKYVTQDITGKIKIDFKNNEALRALSKTLLKKDFDLDVNIPLDRLIPTIPLRLNYILWVEDLLGIFKSDDDMVHGIDIGTGASCVYPLMAAKVHKWHMTATEIDEESFEIARENVQKNNLEDLIQVKQTNGETLLINVLENNTTYDFCMCNPPFFASTTELNPFSKARSDKRTLPRNAYSGSKNEVIAPGGEIEFISKLIKESVDLKTRVKVFTTMTGHKSSLIPLKLLLRTVEVVSFKQTEFHQGHTTRWGLAWTFQALDLRKVPQATVVAARKKPKAPLNYIIPPKTENNSLVETVTRVRELMQTLQMEYEEIKRTQFMIAFTATAKENTWSNQRRKRREQARMKMKDNNNDNSDLNMSCTSTEGETTTSDVSMEVETSHENGHKRSRSESDNEEYFDAKKFKLHENTPVYLKVTIIIRKLSSDYQLEMSWADGTAGKDSVHQVMQYFKNNLK